VSAVAEVIQRDLEQELVEKLYSMRHDPLKAVLYGFPWGEDELKEWDGPWTWQRELLAEVGAHLSNPATRFTPGRFARSSGHGIGKSALVGQIIWWAVSTCKDCRVIVTANTKTQLDTKTQPEVTKWFRFAINAHWWDVNVASIKIKDPEHDRSWRCDFIPWSEDNPQAFAGAHNAGKRLVIICDEASEISDVIFEVIQGALTDANTEILWFQFGNPTRRMGFFYESVFGGLRHRWSQKSIDSREVEGSNKEEIDLWRQDYGEDSDWFRVRVRGLPPNTDSAQYIDAQAIEGARNRIARALPDDALVAGVDFAWGGSDDNIVRFRKGFDARSIPPIKIKGEFTRDPAVMVGKLSDVLTKDYNGEKLAMLFLDSAGIAAPVEARLRALGHRNMMTVNFGADSPDSHYAYMRDFMWGKMKDWLRDGAIDNDPGLAQDLAKPILVSDPKQRVKLESKDVMKRRLARLGLDSCSPDDGDALALTFAAPVANVVISEPVSMGQYGENSWMA
jgi:hypothetical protein